MATIGKIVVKLIAHTGQFQKRMSRAQRTLKRFSRSVFALAGAGGLVIWAKRTLQAADALAKTSAKLGIASDRLAGLQLAAKLSGVEIRTLNMALQRMVRRVSEAASGTGEAKAAIKELGLDAKKLMDLSPDRAFVEIAEAMSKVASQGDRVRLGFKLFDSEGVALIQTLALGRKGLEAAQRQAEMLGLALSGKALKSVEATTDAFTRMVSAAQGIANSLLVTLAPAAKRAADAVTGLAIAVRTGNSLLLSNIGRIAKWTAGLSAAAFIMGKVVGAMRSMVTLYKAIAKSAAITTALTGPRGWAVLGAGIAAAGVSLAAIDSAFADISKSAQQASQMGANYNNEMQSLSATLNSAAINQEKLNVGMRVAAFAKARSQAKSAEDRARTIVTQLGKTLANLFRSPSEAMLAELKRLNVDPKFLKLAQDLADSIDSEMEKRLSKKDSPVARLLKLERAGRTGFKSAKEVAFGGFNQSRRLVSVQESALDVLKRIERKVGGATLA